MRLFRLCPTHICNCYMLVPRRVPWGTAKHPAPLITTITYRSRWKDAVLDMKGPYSQAAGPHKSAVDTASRSCDEAVLSVPRSYRDAGLLNLNTGAAITFTTVPGPLLIPYIAGNGATTVNCGGWIQVQVQQYSAHQQLSIGGAPYLMLSAAEDMGVDLVHAEATALRLSPSQSSLPARVGHTGMRAPNGLQQDSVVTCCR